LWKHYFQRYIRITPLLAYLMVATISISEHLVKNAPYDFHNKLGKPCKQFWWSTLLHIQVQTNTENIVSLVLRFQAIGFYIDLSSVHASDLVSFNRHSDVFACTNFDLSCLEVWTKDFAFSFACVDAAVVTCCISKINER
jgi:hypothetical protein